MKKTSTRVLAVIAALATVLVGAASAQAVPSSTITGTVTDRATGAPVPGACLSLYSQPEIVLATKCADDAGRYTFTGVTDASYLRLRARAANLADLWWPAAPDYYNAKILMIPGWTSTTIQADLAMVSTVGGFAGRITHPDGTPAYDSDVTAYAVTGTWKARAQTDGDGRYRLGNLPVGSYRLAVGPRNQVPVQWVPGRTSSADATVFEVTAGATATVDERYLTTMPSAFIRGAFSGVVTAAATGKPVVGACVTAFGDEYGNEVATSCTDADGRYRIAQISTQYGYKLRVRAEGFPEQWTPDAADSANAQRVYAGWDEDTVVDVALRAGGGTVRGRITEYPGGSGPWSTRVGVSALDGSWSGWATVDNGEYRIDRVPAGDYRLSVRPLGRTIQYHPGTLSKVDAAVVHVTDGEVTTVDEQLLPPGSIEVALVDAVTGAPAPGCVSLTEARETLCAPASGKVTFPEVWGTSTRLETLTVKPGPTHWMKGVADIRVAAGEPTRLTVALRPAAVLEATVVDAKTGSPVANTCVRPVNARTPATDALPHEYANYPNPTCTDSDGKLRMGPLADATVQLLILPPAPYGAQWQGSTGGTGDRRVATKYQLTAGRTVTAPPVRLDGAGSITGTVQGANGSRLTYCARPLGQHIDFSGGTPLTACVPYGTEARYTLSGLGPYRWPVQVDGGIAGDGSLLAPEWTGNATDRYQASLVQVVVGGTTSVPTAELVPAARIRAFDLGPDAPQSWLIQAFHPTTGDVVASYFANQNPASIALPAGPVLLRYKPSTGKACWYVAPGSTRRLASRLTLAAGQAVSTVSLVPGSTCLDVPVGLRPPALRPAA